MIRTPAWSSEGPLPGCRLLLVLLRDGKIWGALQGLFYKVINPIMRAPAS